MHWLAGMAVMLPPSLCLLNQMLKTRLVALSSATILFLLMYMSLFPRRCNVKMSKCLLSDQHNPDHIAIQLSPFKYNFAPAIKAHTVSMHQAIDIVLQ